jgi:hypothetical protein
MKSLTNIQAKYVNNQLKKAIKSGNDRYVNSNDTISFTATNISGKTRVPTYYFNLKLYDSLYKTVREKSGIAFMDNTNEMVIIEFVKDGKEVLSCLNVMNREIVLESARKGIPLESLDLFWGPEDFIKRYKKTIGKYNEEIAELHAKNFTKK